MVSKMRKFSLSMMERGGIEEGINEVGEGEAGAGGVGILSTIIHGLKLSTQN